jgi:hypothetical protein
LIDTTHSSPSWSFYSTIKFIVKCHGNHIKYTTENIHTHPQVGAAMHGLFYSKFNFEKNPGYMHMFAYSNLFTARTDTVKKYSRMANRKLFAV